MVHTALPHNCNTIQEKKCIPDVYCDGLHNQRKSQETIDFQPHGNEWKPMAAGR